KFSPNLAKRDYAIALTRLDAARDTDEKIEEFLSEFKFDKKQDIYEYNHQKPFFVLPISSATGEGLKELKFGLLELLKGEN
ncbi:GTPase ObgE, partial [Campylobacter hyointestinalis subsp. lawsonii]